MSGKPNKLDALLADTRAGAQSVEKGTFRLDWKRALDKVKRFQLTDPHRYVLEIVQGAVAAGATRIAVTTDSDDVMVRYDRAHIAGDALGQLFDYLFAQDQAQLANKQLALGVNSALALEPRFVRVDAGDGKTGHRLELSSHEDLRVTALDGEDVVDGICVHVRDRMGWHVLADVFRARSIEARLVADHCRFVPVPVTLDGRAVNTGVQVDHILEHGWQGEVSGALYLPAEPGHTPQIHVCMNGVEVAPLKAEEISWMESLGVVGYIDDGKLTRNASHTDLHRDDRFKALIKLLARHVRALLEKLVHERLIASRRSLGEADRYYLTQAARALLRAKKKKGKPLSEVDKALLTLENVVELATSVPTHTHLRPVWNAFMSRGAVGVASKRYDVPLSALPKNTLPVLGPPWLSVDVFGNTVENLDELLAATELGQKNRRLREARKRPPELMPGETLVRVPIEGSHQMRGDFGMTESIVNTIRVLVHDSGELPEPADGRDSTLVVFMRDGVPLGGRWVRTPLLLGVALIDSPNFEPDRAWRDIEPNKATAAAAPVLEAAIARLVETMAASFGALPPPRNLREAGAFSPISNQHREVMQSIGAAWPTDNMARAAREQIDHILARRKLGRDEAPGVHAWPIFYTIGGVAVSLDHIDGKVAVEGRGVVAPDQWLAVTETPWGEGEEEGQAILNLTQLQKDAIERQLGRTLRSAENLLKSGRNAAVRRAEIRLRREANIRRAELRRQEPVLPPSEYEVVLDVEVPGGRGQVGIPHLGVDTSWLRPLINGLPLAGHKLDTCVPVHAVVESSKIHADDAFERPLTGPGFKGVVDAVTAAVPNLVTAFVTTPAALTKNGIGVVWQYLHQLKLPRKDPLSRLPEELAHYPLLPAIDGERLSLRQLVDEARGASRKHFRCVEISPGQQETERPVILCSQERRKTITRLTGLRAKDYTDELAIEAAARERMNRPRRRPQLSEPTLLAVTLDDDDFDGEVGIPAGIMGKPGDGGWVDVLIDGVPIERVQVDFSGLPIIAVVSSSKLQPNKAWNRVARNGTWTRAVKALRRAADRLVLRGCELAHERARDFRSPALLVAFQRMAGERFRGRPDGPLEAAGKLNLAVADAPIWESVDHRDFVSLREISEHWRRADVVWLIPTGEGQLAPGRVIVRGAGATEAALREVFGAKVRDGSKVYERDQAAARRRASAPPLETRIVAGVEPADLVAEEGPQGLSARGQVATPVLYAHSERGVRTAIGVDGRRLCEHVFDHPLAGLAQIDCSGLLVDLDWTKPVDHGQLRWLAERVDAALWRSVAAAVAAGGADTDDHRRLMLSHALAAVVDRRGPEELRAPLLAAPLFRTVQRHILSADDLCARKEAGETIYAVSDELDEGNPRDGRILIRGSVQALHALHQILGDALVRDDDRWKRELEGLARFQRLLPSQPALEQRNVSSVFFDVGHTRGVVGLLVPPNKPDYGDDIDARSRVRLHIGGRNICDLSPARHPAIEAWVNDDRLSPNATFDGVDSDDVLQQVLDVVDQQLPELLARAAEHWMSDPDDGTRLRLCRYALDHRARLAAAADAGPADPAARLLDARLWSCLTGQGRESLSSRQLVAVHAAGQLRTADPDAPTEAPEQGIVAVLGGPEARIVEQTLGAVDDYTETLEILAARRAFHRRPKVDRIAVAAVAPAEPLLGRRSLDEPGMVGELALPATPGRGLELHIFVDERRFNTLEVPAVCRAIAAVQSDRIKVSKRYDTIARDRQFDALVQRLREAQWEAVMQLAASLPGLDPARARFARIVLADALSAARASDESAPGFERMRETLENAPLFIDVRGQLWSLRALDEATPADQAIRCVSAETAAIAAMPEGLVVVMDDSMWVSMTRLLRLERDDDRYLEHARGAQRRAAAATSYKLPRGAIASDEIHSPHFSGVLGLSVPIAPGTIGVMSRGRLVQELEQHSFEGLCGFVDGAIETDREFTTARLTDAHVAELERLWHACIERSIAIAADYRGRRSAARWEALAGYTQRYLVQHFGNLGASLPARRRTVLNPDDGVPPVVRSALAVPCVRMGDDTWVDVATAISGDDPLIVVADSPIKRAPRKDARIVIGDAVTLRLLSNLIGSSNVMTVQQAREAVAEARAREEKKRAAAEKAREKRAATAHTRCLSALKSMLREAGKSHFSLEVIKRMSMDSLGRRDLARIEEGAVVVNRDHALWKKAVAAELADAPDAIRHLAVALVAYLAHDEGPFDGQAALGILVRLTRT